MCRFCIGKVNVSEWILTYEWINPRYLEEKPNKCGIVLYQYDPREIINCIRTKSRKRSENNFLYKATIWYKEIKKKINSEIQVIDILTVTKFS